MSHLSPADRARAGAAAIAAVLIAVVALPEAAGAESRPAQIVREPIPKAQKATDQDVERLIQALQGDELLSEAIALQDLANGRGTLDAQTLGPFLQMAGHASERQPNGCRHIRAAYGSSQATVHVALVPEERLLTIAILLRTLGNAAAGDALARTLTAQGLPGAGRFDFSEGNLMVVHSMDTRGLTVADFHRELRHLMNRVRVSQPTWTATQAVAR
jgi:hypothetical protein